MGCGEKEFMGCGGNGVVMGIVCGRNGVVMGIGCGGNGLWWIDCGGNTL